MQELVDQALRELGHHVLTTNNALEALEVLQRVRVDIVVLGDLVDDGGQELVEELRTIQSGLRIISITGPENSVDGVDCIQLPSPLSLDDLREVAAAQLDVS